MEDLFKKFIYTSVGMVSSTAEKIQKKIDELVEKGNLTEEEGKKVVDDLLDTTETKKEEFETRLRDMFKEFGEKFKYVTAKDLEKVISRIDELEAKLEEKANATHEHKA